MGVYLGERLPKNQHSQNLFTLRYDLHFGQFDRQTFVMVPKYGQFVVHFIQSSEESANIFHNTAFDHEDTLSHELLYARFAWSLIRIAGTLNLSNDFRFSDDDDESPGVGGPSGVARDIGGGWGGKRKCGEDDDGREKVAVGGDHGDGGSSEITSDVGGGGRAEKRKRGGDSEEEDAHGGDHGDSSPI